jgi:hypothetical protein
MQYARGIRIVGASIHTINNIARFVSVVKPLRYDIYKGESLGYYSNRAIIRARLINLDGKNSVHFAGRKFQGHADAIYDEDDKGVKY